MKKILWLIQSTGLNSYHPHLNVEILTSLNFEFKDFGLIPFSKEITNLENILEKDLTYIIRGGTKLLTSLSDIENLSELNDFLSEEQKELSSFYIKKLKEGIFYDIQAFDQEFYRHKSLPLLNATAEIIPYEDIKNTSFKEDMFIKPSRDLKAFNGGILEKEMTIKEFILNSMHQPFFEEEQIVISPLKNIYAEYRFFVVNKKVITGSQYRRGGYFNQSSLIDKIVFYVAQEYAELYQPAEIFTLDIAETKNGFEIVEYNCFNASGLYHSDGKKLFFEINEYIKGK